MTRFPHLRAYVIIPLLSFLLLSCGKKEQKETDLVTFPLRGEVVGIDSVNRVVTIAHEAIPNYMNAMVMPFKIKDPALLKGIAIGDSIGATLAVSRTESWLETLHVLRKGENVEATPAEEIEFKRLYHEGELLPDETFLNQDGAPVRLSDLKGKAVALTFIYTRCPLPDFCIRMSENFRRLQKQLASEPALSGEWHLVSVSFDPTYDRPPVLKQYGRNYGADFSTWDFVTDPDSSGRMLERFADGFGLTYIPEAGSFTHNLRTALLDKEGTLVKVIVGNEWKPEEVVKEIRKLAG
jgi:protein SCO1/2